MAYLMKRARGSEIRWVIRWMDPFKGQGKAGDREVDCASGDHEIALAAAGASSEERVALVDGAHNQPLRQKLLRIYEALETERAKESTAYEGIGRRPLYETQIESLLNEFVEHMRTQVELRRIHGRQRGRAQRTLESYEQSFRRFREFLKARGQTSMMSGQIQAATLRDFRGWLDTCKSRHDAKALSLATVNMVVRCMRCFIGFFCQDEDTRPYFRASEKGLRRALGAAQCALGQPKYFSNDELARLFEAALARDSNDTVKVVRSKPASLEPEIFEMRRDLTPVFPWVAMLTLTGARVHELEGLKWGDIDLERGTLVIRPQVALKTGRPRIFAFADKRWPVAPALVEYLKASRADLEKRLPSDSAGSDLNNMSVLPANGASGNSTFPRKVFEDVVRGAGLKFTAKGLRSNFCSRMVAQGVSPAIVGMLVGHSAEVEAAHYLTYPFDSQTGLVLSDAMGVTSFIEQATKRLSTTVVVHAENVSGGGG